MKANITYLIFSGVVIIFSACKKDIKPQSTPTPQPVQTQLQAQVAAITREVANALEKVYEDPKAYKEVDAAILSGYYVDERIPLRELLLPSRDGVYNCHSFKTHHVDTGRFRKRFCEVIFNGNYPILKQQIGPLLNRHLVSGVINAQMLDDTIPGVLSDKYPVCIYFPYSENFGAALNYDSVIASNQVGSLRPTIAYTDREDDTAPGKRPYFCTSSPNKLCYADVTVNDAYAEVYATHIVTTGAATIASAPLEILKTELVTRAYHGWSRLTRQMDKLFSFTGNGGGSEIKICRVNGFLKTTDEQVTNFAGDIITANYTRADIRKKRFKRIYSVWDPNWNYQDIEQVYAVYEDDNTGSRTISGSLNTTVNLPGKLAKAEGEVGFKISVITQDEIITQRKFDRKSYLRDGMNNQGWGFMADQNDFLVLNKDWPIYDAGSIWSYTFPYRIY